jgi:hypothetical protein
MISRDSRSLFGWPLKRGIISSSSPAEPLRAVRRRSLALFICDHESLRNFRPTVLDRFGQKFTGGLYSLAPGPRRGPKKGKLWQGLLTGKRTVRSAYWGMSESGHRSCKCGAVYDRSEHMVAEREISSFECAVCGATIENWNSAWVPRYRFIACPAKDAE